DALGMRDSGLAPSAKASSTARERGRKPLCRETAAEFRRSCRSDPRRPQESGIRNQESGIRNQESGIRAVPAICCGVRLQRDLRIRDPRRSVWSRMVGTVDDDDRQRSDLFLQFESELLLERDREWRRWCLVAARIQADRSPGGLSLGGELEHEGEETGETGA